ncbi:hypothetical protein G6F55_004256 [Rhizopus delemar]|uniref:non-specific serine/threonine protein kinase n=2 Tax=Rhizopus TaxID=4842 RepID=A0A9P7CQU8_9FUNG|nr:hypothetical protein G6F55_004256 [Rhizopus delemar]KAG1544498.1 hypothetical protein G6F51_006024 [Rhizopus arrhizus]KAG1555743.1 hypothetical protein G6F49_006890 [Rhizopus delemar]KAG1571447.1 hypothetical protein G6F50_004606 [Rhizopus delemar]KAG1586747.1 hypothetical protein G6F48_006394 [Rhizopus delemar]
MKQNKLGSYNLLQTLGEGEFGKVKLGIHSETGEEVAIKLIRKDGIGSDNRINKVEREISILKNLKHPYIVKLYDVLETEKYVGLVLEYASGGELFEYILAHRYLKEKDAKRFFAQLISSVQYMHKCKIVHRDLKLENVLIDKNRNIIVTDFGFANQFSTAADDMMSTTCGSPCYAAPELVVNAGLYAGSAVDIWSCGVILFAMLCGFLPFDDDPSNPDSDDINQLYRYILSTRLVFPSYISSEARDLMEKMLVPDPAKRCTLEFVTRHVWLEDYRDLLIPERRMNDNSTFEPVIPSILKRGLSTRRSPHQPNRDRFAPLANDGFIVKQSNGHSEKELLTEIQMTPSASSATYSSKLARQNSTRSSKISKFITRKPVKEIISPPTIPEASTSSENYPEKSLSTPYIPSNPSKRPTDPQPKEKFLGFFSKSPAKASEDVDHSETLTIDNSSPSLVSPCPTEESLGTKSLFSRLAEESSGLSNLSESGMTASTRSSVSFKDPNMNLPRRADTTSYRITRNSAIRHDHQPYPNDNSSVSSSSGSIPLPEPTQSSRFTMAAVRRSIYRKTKNPASTESSKLPLTLSRKTQESSNPKKNIHAPEKRSPQQMQPQQQQNKKTGKKMMDWIKKKSHGKQQEPLVSAQIASAELTPTTAAPADRPHETLEIPQAEIEGRGRTLSSNALGLEKKEESLIDTSIQIHQGPIDRAALTSRPPQRIIKDVSHILRVLGIEALSDDEDGPFVLKCTRRSSSKHKEEQSDLQPIYGEPSIDSGEEIRFVVEICRFKNLPGLFIVDVKRLKGSVWAYKFLYHKLIDFLNLNKDDYL